MQQVPLGWRLGRVYGGRSHLLFRLWQVSGLARREFSKWRQDQETQYLASTLTDKLVQCICRRWIEHKAEQCLHSRWNSSWLAPTWEIHSIIVCMGQERENSALTVGAPEVSSRSFPVRCGKQEIQIKSEGLSVKSFVKGCTTKAQCDNSKELVLKLCEQNKKAGADATCELNCCSGDLCNAGTAPVVSAVLILACAVLALFQWAAAQPMSPRAYTAECEAIIAD